MLDKLDPKADAIIKRGIHSHEVWRDYLKYDSTYSTNDVGTVKQHEQWIEDYEYLRTALISALSNTTVNSATEKRKIRYYDPYPLTDPDIKDLK